MMNQFFHRIEGLNLVDGNKSAGFLLYIETETLRKLRSLPVSPGEYQTLVARMRERVIRAKLLPNKAVSDCGITLVGETACPLMFTTNPMFGASVGGPPEDLARLGEPHRLDHLGPTMLYTSHNVDVAAQALVLMILVETWVEWAHANLVIRNRTRQTLQPYEDFHYVVSLKGYLHSRKAGVLAEDDGVGYYATGEGLSNIPVSEEKPEWATHVAWHE